MRGLFWSVGLTLLLIIGVPFVSALDNWANPTEFINLTERNNSINWTSIDYNGTDYLASIRSGDNWIVYGFNKNGASNDYSRGDEIAIGIDGQIAAYLPNRTFAIVSTTNFNMYNYTPDGSGAISSDSNGVGGHGRGLAFNNSHRVHTYENSGEKWVIERVLDSGIENSGTFSTISQVAGVTFNYDNNSWWVLDNSTGLVIEFDLQFSNTGRNFTLYNPSTTNLDVTYYNDSFYVLDAVTQAVYQYEPVGHLNVTIRNEKTNNIITDSVTLELYGDVLDNATITNGHYLFENLSFGDYEIIYDSGDYTERNYFFTVSEAGLTSTDLFLLDNSNSTAVSITMKDESFDELEGAILQVLKRNALNVFELVEMEKTAFDGTGTINVEDNGPLYKFKVLVNNVVRLETIGAVINSQHVASGLNFQVNTITDQLNVIDTLEGVTANVVNDVTNNLFTFTYTDTGGTVTQGCLDVHRITNFNIETTNTSCSTSSSAVITIAVDNTTTAQYVAVGKLESNNAQVIADTENRVIDGAGIAGTIGLLGFFLVALIVIVGSLIAQNNPKVAVVIGVLAIGVGTLSGIIVLSTPIIIMLVIGGLVAAATMKLQPT